MKLIAVKCPQCDATIDIDEQRKSCFCMYCGTKIILDDGSRTYTYIHIDKTREKEIEFEERQFEVECNRQDEQVKQSRVVAICLCITVILAMVTFLIVKRDFDISINYSLMIIGCVTAFARMWNKRTALGAILASLVLDIACTAFIIMRTDFYNTFTLTLALPICFHIIASIVNQKKS